MEYTCQVCAAEVQGNFCSNCGQSTETRRITWRYFFVELQDRLFGFDNRFMRTLKDLTLRPEKVIHAAIDGVRVRYFGPMSYYFLLITFYVLLVSLLEVDMKQYGQPFGANVTGQTEGQEAFQENMGDLIFNNFRVWSFILLPFFILGNYLVFKNKKYNYLENGVLVLYAMGQTTIMSILYLFFYKVHNTPAGIFIIMILSFLYIAWVCSRFFEGNRLWNFVKGILGFFLSYMIIMVIAIVGTVLYILLVPGAKDSFLQ